MAGAPVAVTPFSARRGSAAGSALAAGALSTASTTVPYSWTRVFEGDGEGDGEAEGDGEGVAEADGAPVRADGGRAVLAAVGAARAGAGRRAPG